MLELAELLPDLAPALNADQVRAALTGSGWDEPLAEDLLLRALDALVRWGLLEATQNRTAHYATPQEFERKNLQWSLTSKGEAAIGGLLRALESLRLRLRDECKGPPTTPGRLWAPACGEKALPFDGGLTFDSIQT